jgi:hypothetical protein
VIPTHDDLRLLISYKSGARRARCEEASSSEEPATATCCTSVVAKTVASNRNGSGASVQKAAEDALGEALGRISAGQFSDPGRLTLGDFLDQWIDAAVSGLRPSTAASYRMLLVKRVGPRIGSIRLASLTPGHLTGLYATLLTEGGKGGGPLSARSVRCTHTVLGKALDDAVDWGLLARNPARSAKPPRVVKPEMSVWSAEDAKSSS